MKRVKFNAMFTLNFTRSIKLASYLKRTLVPTILMTMKLLIKDK